MKEDIINEIIRVEGGYVNDPSDSGGETNFGITEEVARAHGYTGAMIDLPKQFAFDIYSNKYWNSVNADKIMQLSASLTEKIVDISVNMGPKRAGIFLQRALNALNNIATLYDDLNVDGQIGSKTLKALESYLDKRSSNILIKAINCLQGAFYIELAERREKDEKFVYGWLKNRVAL